MNLVVSLLILSMVGMVASGPIDCKQLLETAFDGGCGSKCVTISGNGLSPDGIHISFKGHLIHQGGVLVQKDKVNFLVSSFYECNDNCKYQPFLVDNISTFPKFNLYSNGSIQIGDNCVELKCMSEHLNIFQFCFSGITFSFVLTINEYSCPPLYFGESCTSTPSETPTPTKLVIEVTIKNSWVTNGVEYSQFNVVIKNNGNEQINHLVLGATNFNPTEKWNIDTLPNGDLSMPSYGHIAPNGGTFEWGFVARSDSQHQFTIKSASN